MTNSRATYGYRRVWAMVNRTFRTGYNRKRIRRVMQLHGLMLAPRVHRRHGRPHLGQIRQPASNRRWCSDVFLIPCWSGEVISVAFAIDCHDREVPAYVASPRPLTGADIRTLMDRTLWARFGEAALKAPHAIQWLSDNGPQYTATATVLYAHELGLVPITTPAYSPESNGLAEAFVGHSSATISAMWISATPRRCSPISGGGSTTTTPRRRTRRSGCEARANIEPLRLRRRRRSWLRTRDRAVGRYLHTPRKSGWSRPVRAANLSSPPEQKIGEHSRTGTRSLAVSSWQASISGPCRSLADGRL